MTAVVRYQPMRRGLPTAIISDALNQNTSTPAIVSVCIDIVTYMATTIGTNGNLSQTELDKRLDAELEGSGSSETADSATTESPAVDLALEEPIHPDLIETVAFCKNIRNVQVLTDAIKGFQGRALWPNVGI